MSISCGFYSSVDHDRQYNALQLSSLFDNLINDGIFMAIGTAMVVEAGSGMGVNVGIGKAWFNHTWTFNDAILPLTIEASELVLNRTDAVVLDVDARTSVRNNTIKVIKGTPSSTPVSPTLLSETDHKQYPLCYIAVRKGATEILQSDIVNLVGTEACPFITGILQTINIDTLIAQWGAQWSAWFSSTTNTAASDMDALETSAQADFDAWFADLQVVLNGTDATSLAAAILDLQNHSVSSTNNILSAILKVNAAAAATVTSAQVRNISAHTTAPLDTDGQNGDIWCVYEADS